MDGGIELNDKDPKEDSKMSRQSTKASIPSRPIDVAREFVKDVTESTVVTVFMSVATIWALFDDDIRLSATEPEADLPFEVIISICFFAFIAEVLAGCFYKEGYVKLPIMEKFHDPKWSVRFFNLFHFGSFYFWLDLIATFSLVTEVSYRACVIMQRPLFIYIIPICDIILIGYYICICTDAVDGPPRNFWFTKFEISSSRSRVQSGGPRGAYCPHRQNDQAVQVCNGAERQKG